MQTLEFMFLIIGRGTSHIAVPQYPQGISCVYIMEIMTRNIKPELYILVFGFLQ